MSKQWIWTLRPRVRIANAGPLMVFLLASLVLAAQTPPSHGFNVLYSFADSPDGANPYQSSVVQDAAGDLYGTTLYGGNGTNGTAFRVSSTGEETVLHHFKANPNRLAPQPISGVIRDDAGNLYGTTVHGGPSGYGSIFKLDTSGQATILHKFNGGGDGAWAYGGLVRDAQGTLYGTTAGAGDPKGCGNGCGTVFKLDKTGKFTVLYTFTGGADGGISVASLILDNAGNLYGTTLAGGTYNQGTVFKVSPAGQETPLYSFTGAADGEEPAAGLTLDSAGNLYGTTFYAGGGNCFNGTNPGCGTVFKLDRSGTFTLLHSFTGGDDGGWSTGVLALDAMGNLYGTASGGGVFGAGTIFKIGKAGAFSLLHTFTGGRDGTDPMAGVILGAGGTLYGTAAGGGASGYGVVFKLTP